MNRSLDYRVSLMAFAAIVAVNAIPWFTEPFTMLLSEPLLALRLLVGRLILVGVVVGLVLAVRRYGWVSVALFFLNPMLAAGWLRARSWYAEKTEEAGAPGSDAGCAREPSPKVTPKPAPSFAPETRETGMLARAPSKPKRMKMTTSDLGPPKKDRFADSPIYSRKRGLFG